MRNEPVRAKRHLRSPSAARLKKIQRRPVVAVWKRKGLALESKPFGKPAHALTSLQQLFGEAQFGEGRMVDTVRTDCESFRMSTSTCSVHT